MKTHRFIGNFSLKPGLLMLTDSDLVHQVWDVLKLRPPEIIILADGELHEGQAKIVERNDRGIQVEVTQITQNENEPQRHIVLYCSILKKENFELVCQKATEIGVSEIIPIITDRTVKLNIKPERLETIMKEAAEQSGRGKLPILKPAIDFTEAITEAGKPVWFCDRGGQLPAAVTVDTVSLFIGPEGGWSDREREMAANQGATTVSFGKTTLRAETAALIAVYCALR